MTRRRASRGYPSAGPAYFAIRRSRSAPVLTTEQTLEAYGSRGALQYRCAREGAQWWRGELRAASGPGPFAPVRVRAGLPRSAGQSDQLELVGKTTIAPLVARFLQGIEKGENPSPSFEDGTRAQALLDAVLSSLSRGGWVSIAG